MCRLGHPILRRTQEGCGSLGGENSAAFPKTGPIFKQPFSLPENAQTLAGIAHRAARKSENNFPAASKICLKVFPATNFGQPQPSRAFGNTNARWAKPIPTHCPSIFCMCQSQVSFEDFCRVHIITERPFPARSLSIYSGQVRPRQGTEICNFGAPSPLEALHWIFCFFSSIYVQFSKTSPTASGESSEKSSGENRVKSCHVCGCHGFFGPDVRTVISYKHSVLTKS